MLMKIINIVILLSDDNMTKLMPSGINSNKKGFKHKPLKTLIYNRLNKSIDKIIKSTFNVLSKWLGYFLIFALTSVIQIRPQSQYLEMKKPELIWFFRFISEKYLL